MSPHASDDQRIEQEKSSANGAAQTPGRGDPPRFTLIGVLFFFTALGVCIWLGVAGSRMSFDRGVWVYALSLILAWIVLCLTYRRLHLRVAFAAHWLGLALAAGVALVFELTRHASDPAQIASQPARMLFVLLFFPIYHGCVFGSVLSVPIFVVTMVASLLKGALRRSG
jgi:hypothetical protein